MIEPLILIIGLCNLVIAVSLLTKSSFIWPSRAKKVIIDTSTLMDGRVIELVNTGFLSGQIIVSSRVVEEMQNLADNGSSIKRERARLGLDVLKELQASKGVRIKMYRSKQSRPVDDELRFLAKRLKAYLMTNDFNLAKVASLDNTKILNINELARTLHPTRLPGEQIEIKLVQKGAEHNQAVGYLDDGTMVVVDNAAKRIGTSANVLISRNLQTAAGKMCFAEIINKNQSIAKGLKTYK